MSTKKTLFVTWDGPSTNYLESLFLPIFSQLQDDDISDFFVLQLGWGRSEDGGDAGRVSEKLGIKYKYLALPDKRKSIMLLPVLVKACSIILKHMRSENAYVMPRSIVPAALVIISRVLTRSGKVIYDADGLMMEERVEFGGWSKTGLAYRFCRTIERLIIKQSSAVMTRTDSCSQVLIERNHKIKKMPPFITIPNCKNEHAFVLNSRSQRTLVRAKLGVPENGILMVYAGSLGPQYKPEIMADIFKRVSRKRLDAHFLILTSDISNAKKYVEAAGIQSQRFTIRSLPAHAVPEALSATDYGLCLREPSLSQLAVSPIKVTEYLLSGLNLIYNRGIGDLEKKLSGQNFAYMLKDWSDSEQERTADWVAERAGKNSDNTRISARGIGLQYFSISSNIALYRELFALAETRQ